MKYIILALFTIVETWGNVARYDNYKVYRVIPETDLQLIQLTEIKNNGYDIWKEPTNKNNLVDIMVPPLKTTEFYDIMNKMQIEPSVYIENVQGLIEKSTPKAKSNRAFDWADYYRINEINAWLGTLPSRFPGIATLVVGGRSYEGRNITGVKVSYREGNQVVFLEAGTHAREWISPATATFILNELITSQDSAVRDIAESYDWYFFPSVNPDGYEYTFDYDRFWRKTRQPYGKGCVGADPNRNWDFHWMDGGASDSPCSESYAGSAPFSDIETRTLSEFITSISSNMVAYFDFHSYSQFLMIPYGHTHEHLDNYEELMEIGRKATDSLAQRYGTDYIVGSIADLINSTATGSSLDWVKGTLHIPITYAYELRDKGGYGFLLPPEQIIPTGEEVLDSIITIMQEARRRGY